MAAPGKNTNSDEDIRRQLSRDVRRIQHGGVANIYSDRHAVISRDPRIRTVAMVPGSSQSAPNASRPLGAQSLQNRVTPFSLQRDSNQAQQMLMRNSPPSFGAVTNRNIRMPFPVSQQQQQQQQQQQLLMQALMFQNQARARLPSPIPSNLPVNPFALGLMALSQSRQRMVSTQQSNPNLSPRSAVAQQNTFQRSINPMELIAKAKKVENTETQRVIQEKKPQETETVSADPLQMIAAAKQLSKSNVTTENVSEFSPEPNTDETVSVSAAELEPPVARPKEPVSPSSMVRTFHGNTMIQGTKQGKHYRNVLNRMEAFQFEVGPMSVMYRSVKERLKVKVWVRSATHVRGICTGYIVAFDKHWNLAMADVDEVFQKPKKRREKVWRNVHYIPEITEVKEENKDVQNENSDIENENTNGEQMSEASLSCVNDTEKQKNIPDKSDISDDKKVETLCDKQKNASNREEVPGSGLTSEIDACEKPEISDGQQSPEGVTDQSSNRELVKAEEVAEIVTENINDIQNENIHVGEEDVLEIEQDCDSNYDDEMIDETEEVNMQEEKDLEAEEELDNLGICDKANDELDIDALTEQLSKIRELLEALSSSEEESEDEEKTSDMDGTESCNSDAGQDSEIRDSENDELESNNSDACKDEIESNNGEVGEENEMEEKNDEAVNEMIEKDPGSDTGSHHTHESEKSEGEISDSSEEEETQSKVNMENEEAKTRQQRSRRRKSGDSSRRKSSRKDSKRSSRSEKESSKSSTRIHHNSSRSSQPSRRSSSDSQRSRDSDRNQRRSSRDEDQYSRQSKQAGQSQRRSSQSEEGRLRSERRSSHSDSPRSSRSPHSDDQRSPQRRSHSDDKRRSHKDNQSKDESIRSRESRHRSHDKNRKETDREKRGDPKSYDLRTKLLRKNKMSTETKLKKEDERRDRKRSPKRDKQRPSRHEEEKYNRDHRSCESDSRTKNYSTDKNKLKYQIKDKSIPPDCSLLKKEKGGQIILQRHVNQMFIRGDNVVMVAIAPWF